MREVDLGLDYSVLNGFFEYGAAEEERLGNLAPQYLPQYLRRAKP